MSTKQTVIVSFMILFLAVMLGALGAWFHYSFEVDALTKTRDALTLRKRQLEAQINSNEAIKYVGLEKRITDPDNGLAAQFETAKKSAEKAEGDVNSGMVQARNIYGNHETDLKKREPEVKAKWKALYADWEKKNGEINAQRAKFKAQQDEEQTKKDAAAKDLETALQEETVQKKDFVEKKKKMAELITELRAQQENTGLKIDAVTRERRKSTTIEPQGRIIHADATLLTANIDIGRDQGLRKGMQFDVYSGAHSGLVKKGRIEVASVLSSSAECIVLPAKVETRRDPQTGWEPPDPRMRFSIFSTKGDDETTPVELEKPKTRQDRIEAYRQRKLEEELTPEELEKRRAAGEAPPAPPVELGKGFIPILPGDWINNPDFVPIIPETVYQKKTVNELLAMRDVNVGTQTFYFAESIKQPRKEVFTRLCERNQCKTAEVMSADVNYVVAPAGMSDPVLLAERLKKDKDKEEVSADVKAQRKTLAALLDAKKYGARILAEDEVEGYFAQRQRKMELLRVKTVQPGRSTFFVAGETKQRSVEHVRAYIRDHGGVVAAELDDKTDIIVVGAGLDQAFYDKIRKLGVKVMREDELPRFFGLE